MTSAGTTPYSNSVFEQPWWLETVAPGDWDEVFVKDGGGVIARLPFVMKGRHIIMPPLTQTLGPWIKPDLLAKRPGNAQYGQIKEIVYALVEQLPNHRSVAITLDCSNDYILPYRWLGFSYEPTFSYRIPMADDLSAIEADCHKKVRKSIRRSVEETRIETFPDADILTSIMRTTFTHQNRKYPYSDELLCDIVQTSIQHDSGAMFTAFDKDGNVQAASFLLYDENVAYALIGGSDPHYRGIHSKTAVYWKEIEYAHKRSRFFDFEGSSIEGIEHLMRQFGGAPVVNYHVSKRTLLGDCMAAAKPHIKRMIGFRI